LWHAALRTADSIRADKPLAKRDWASQDEEAQARFFRGQHPNSLRAGRQLASRINFSGFRHLLDAGGGTGGVAVGICEVNPGLRATVSDLPTVAGVSVRLVAESGLSNRIDVVGADLVASRPPGSYDVAVLRALLQVLTPSQAQCVLRNVFDALEPGGQIYVAGCILDDTRIGPPAAIAFSLVFINVYDSGGAYTESQYRAWLGAAGFVDVVIEHDVLLSDGLGVISARRPNG
jgi:SAM-dependent methyltransferase